MLLNLVIYCVLTEYYTDGAFNEVSTALRFINYLILNKFFR